MACRVSRIGYSIYTVMNKLVANLSGIQWSFLSYASYEFGDRSSLATSVLALATCTSSEQLSETIRVWVCLQIFSHQTSIDFYQCYLAGLIGSQKKNSVDGN